MLPDIERLSPNQIAALRKQLAEFDKLNQAQQPWAKYQEVAQNGTVEQLMEASKAAPSEFVDNLVQQAAWKAFNQANEQRKLAEGRALLSHISSAEERVGILCQLAAGAATKGDKPAALQ